MQKKIFVGCFWFFVSCHKQEIAPPTKTTASSTWDVSDGFQESGGGDSGVAAKGLYEGRLSDSEIKESFDAKQQEVLACFQSGKKRNRYLDGDIRLSFEITAQGKPQNLFISESTLGDFEVEACFITLVNTMPLPKPIGGAVLAGYSLGYHPSAKPKGSGTPNDDERAKYLLGAKDALKACKKLPKSFQAVVWIQPEGEALSAGYSADSLEAHSESKCVTEALVAGKYPKSYRKATYLLLTAEELTAP